MRQAGSLLIRTIKPFLKTGASVIYGSLAALISSTAVRKFGVIQLHLGSAPIRQQAQINQHSHRNHALGGVVGGFFQPAPTSKTSRSTWNYREGACWVLSLISTKSVMRQSRYSLKYLRRLAYSNSSRELFLYHNL